MVTLMGALGSYDRAILTKTEGVGFDVKLSDEERGIVEEQHAVEHMTLTVTYRTANFVWPCGKPELILPVLKLFLRVSKERQAGVLSFGICVNGGMPDDGLVEKVKEAFSAAVNKPKGEIELGYLPIEGKRGPLACAISFANIKNYA